MAACTEEAEVEPPDGAATEAARPGSSAGPGAGARLSFDTAADPVGADLDGRYERAATGVTNGSECDDSDGR